jgi:hypothetical protein
MISETVVGRSIDMVLFGSSSEKLELGRHYVSRLRA